MFLKCDYYRYSPCIFSYRFTVYDHHKACHGVGDGDASTPVSTAQPSTNQRDDSRPGETHTYIRSHTHITGHSTVAKLCQRCTFPGAVQIVAPGKSIITHCQVGCPDQVKVPSGKCHFWRKSGSNFTQLFSIWFMTRLKWAPCLGPTPNRAQHRNYPQHRNNKIPQTTVITSRNHQGCIINTKTVLATCIGVPGVVSPLNYEIAKFFFGYLFDKSLTISPGRKNNLRLLISSAQLIKDWL